MFRAPILVLALGVFFVLAEDLLPDKYDYINVSEILANDRLREQYYDCFLDTAPCITPDAKFFKDFLPEVIATQCRRCTERQKGWFGEVSAWYAENDKEKWDKLIAKLLETAKKMKIANNS